MSRALQTAQRMRRNHLDCQHRLNFVVGANPMNRREYSVDVLLTWRMTGGAIIGRTDEAIEQISGKSLVQSGRILFSS
jgi:hypothetical protein